MNIKQEILDIPRVLEEMLEKGRPEYEAVVRRTRWGEAPIYVVGSGASFLAGLTAVCAFETLLGWPVVARPTAAFRAYGIPLLRPGSVLLAISDWGESEELLEAGRVARARGATLLAVTPDAMSPLAQAADGAFPVWCGKDSAGDVKVLLATQAALGFISLIASQVLKRHHPQLDVLEQEFEKLPRHVDWVLGQLPDAVRSAAAELKDIRRLVMAGAGFYHPAALQGAFLMRRLARLEAEGCEVSEFGSGGLGAASPDSVVAFLSGSSCRLKKQAHQAAARVRSAGTKIISVTDSNDRELAEISTLTVLLPTLTEMVGSTLALVLTAWVAYQTGREKGISEDSGPKGSIGRSRKAW